MDPQRFRLAWRCLYTKRVGCSEYLPREIAQARLDCAKEEFGSDFEYWLEPEISTEIKNAQNTEASSIQSWKTS